MANKTYSEKLKDPRWQKKRLLILERDCWVCQNCCMDDKTLHVHHRRYDKQFKEPWDYPDEFLVTLCEDCHAQETETMPDTLKYLCQVFQEKFFSSEILTLIKGLEKYPMPHMPEVCATAIAFALSDKQTACQIVDKYFEYLKSTVNVSSEHPF